MNSLILTGHIGADIKPGNSNGTDYAHFSIATNYRAKTADGWEDRVTWTRVTAFNGLARALGCLGKGSLISLRGHLETTVTERDGVRFEHSQVIADDVEFLRTKKPGGEQADGLAQEDADAA